MGATLPTQAMGAGFTLALSSLLLGISLTCCALDIRELLPLKCRIAGVVLVERKLNYTMAETACEILGLQLASRIDVQKAWRFGYETCSYGWVTDKFGVIPRIQNNEKCGKNQTGVLTWTVPLTRDFSAYCFNSSDLRINSCKPELMVTIPPPLPSITVPTTASPPPPTILPPTRAPARPTPPTTKRETTSQSVTTEPTTTAREAPPTPTPITTPTEAPPIPTPITTPREAPPIPTPITTPREAPPVTKPITTPKEAPPITTPRMTTPPPTEEPTHPPKNQAARQSERIIFGKLPTTLLILALVFFIAAVALAICYIRKYKTSVFFRKIEEEKESVEAKVFKETASADAAKETIPKEEEPRTPEGDTGRSGEAEV
ncbi:lymphatic vessel endothelial hyaluronic acid receptor 1 [Mantella aurantiaca]